MTFIFRAYYEDDSLMNYGEERHEFIRARSKAQAVEKFRRKYGADPIGVD